MVVSSILFISCEEPIPSANVPTISPYGGLISPNDTITITSTTPDAQLYYTLNYQGPSSSYTRYTGPFTLEKSGITVVAKAVHAAMEDSPLAISDSFFLRETVDTPMITPDVRFILPSDTITLTTTTEGATIHYTVDASVPTASSQQYTEPFNLTSTNTVVKAIAVYPDMLDSLVATSDAYLFKVPASSPTITPNEGPIAPTQEITLATTTEGANIHFTLDGSDPTASSEKYTGPFTLHSTGLTVKAIAVHDNFIDSEIFVSNPYMIRAAKPTFVPAGGSTETYPASISVSLNCATSGASIYYTTNGETPVPEDANTSLYDTEVLIDKNTVVKAVAVHPNYATSEVAVSSQYTIKAAMPSFSSTASGTVTYPNTTTVQISSSMAEKIFFTTDGSTPTANSALYDSSHPIEIDKNTAVKAISTHPDYLDSEVAESQHYTFRAPKPTFSLAEGTYGTSQTVTLGSTLSGATFLYTTDGTDPSGSSTEPTGSTSVTSGSVEITKNMMVKAIAVHADYENSEVSESPQYLIRAVKPTFSPAEGTIVTFPNNQLVTLESATSGATIYYTRNGETPDPTNKDTTFKYTTGIRTRNNTVLRAIAVHPNYVNSEVSVSPQYTMKEVIPRFTSTAGGLVTYPDTNTVNLVSSTAEKIFYTTDGTIPTIESTQYDNLYPIVISKNTVVKAIATRPLFDNSDVAVSQEYKIIASAPTFSPDGGTFTSSQTVTLQSELSGATFLYTTDGSDPAGSSLATNGPVEITKSSEIRALVVHPHYENSVSATSKRYTIEVADLSLSPASGESAQYPEKHIVTLNCATPDVSIFYTLDGSEPTKYSTLYGQENPIHVTSCTTLRAIALKEGLVGSDAISASYVVTGPAGGLVFYDKGNDEGGWRYLEAAPQSTEFVGKQWSASTKGTSSTATSIGTGASNTDGIVLIHGEEASAAKLCSDLAYGGFGDWFMPSLDELVAMYTKLKKSGLGGFSDGLYWSSSEFYLNSDSAFYRDFTTDYTGYSIKKSDLASVRAIRAF